MPLALPRYQALPLPDRLALHSPSADAPAYPAHFRDVPAPVHLPWGLKPMGSAVSGIDTLADGRTRCWIRHEVVRGVTPRMLAWWFAHLEGDVEVGGVRINRYRVWHPYDHVHASYARRLPDGSVGPGAAIHLREMLGANPAYVVDVVTDIEKLDEEGFIHNPVVHGIRGLARMEYRFKAVAEGTQYENCLLFGGRGTVARRLHPLLSRLAFPDGKGAAWLRHNIEEVGMFENFLPGLYRQETGLDG
ncbi:MAG: hypothetical protein V4679_22075 [Pseudomonadota bacterium]